jgi:hydrogenase expression/formation protein HypD
LKFVDEFRRGDNARQLVQAIGDVSGSISMTMMEVCGTHTMAIARFGIRDLLPENIRLISGPGCPVCVTPNAYVDRAVAFSRIPDTVVATFGDMIRVPGSSSSLERERAAGRDVRVVFSTLDALDLAEALPNKKIVFLGVGFETTAPTVAASILEAGRRSLNNYFVYSGHKVMPPAMEAISQGDVHIDGYLCPGHVSTVIGSRPYDHLVRRYGIGCVISGFEPLDILRSIYLLAKQIREKSPRVEVEYTRAVRSEGNPKALALLDDVFEPADSEWRGLGNIAKSGLAMRDAFLDRDAERQIPVDTEPVTEIRECRCGDVLQGKMLPSACPLFGKRCTPEEPVGACMVSSEGTCAAFFRFGSQSGERETEIHRSRKTRRRQPKTER